MFSWSSLYNFFFVNGSVLLYCIIIIIVIITIINIMIILSIIIVIIINSFLLCNISDGKNELKLIKDQIRDSEKSISHLEQVLEMFK